jgi:cyclopropane-fatty-acyl-phospholipid synthase
MNSITPRRGRHMVGLVGSRRQRLIARLFAPMLNKIDERIEIGAIELMTPDGRFRILGGRAPGPVAHIDLNRWRALVRAARLGAIGWFEAWEKEEWSSPDVMPFFEIILRNRSTLGNVARATGLARLKRRIIHALRRNNRRGARRNILAHYDLGNDFYAAWLDKTMSYSSGLFVQPRNGDETLEAAQRRKVSAIGKRLKLKPKSSVLEIGSGWGYFAKICARKGHDVTGITLSPSQKLYAERGLAALANPPKFELRDYRDMIGQFDAIASVEMVEAVGQRYWPDFLDAVARLLKPGGRAALQYIAVADDVFDAYSKGVDFIQAYIFPGGMLLSESRFRALAEARGLAWTDVHHFPLDYAETLRRWRARFDDAVAEGKLPAGFDARFVRLWRYYLMYCEGGFRGGGITVAQVTLIKE